MTEIYQWLAMWSPAALAFLVLMIPVANAVQARRERRAFIPRPYIGETIYGREKLVLPSFPDEANIPP